MKDITITFRAPLYLRQWLIAHFGHPVRFPPRSYENALLRDLLTLPPSGFRPSPPDPSCSLQIVLPDSRRRKPEHYHYLSRRARAEFLSALERLFRLQLWRAALSIFESDRPLGASIASWCLENGIGVDGHEAVSKKVYRMRREYARHGIFFHFSGEKKRKFIKSLRR